MISLKNQMEGTVSSVTKGPRVTAVKIAVDNSSLTLSSIISTHSSNALNLQPGAPVHVSISEFNMIVCSKGPKTPPSSSMNYMTGIVMEVQEGACDCIIRLEISSGEVFTACTSYKSAMALGIHIGMQVTFLVKPKDVLLARPDMVGIEGDLVAVSNTASNPTVMKEGVRARQDQALLWYFKTPMGGVLNIVAKSEKARSMDVYRLVGGYKIHLKSKYGRELEYTAKGVPGNRYLVKIHSSENPIQPICAASCKFEKNQYSEKNEGLGAKWIPSNPQHRTSDTYTFARWYMKAKYVNSWLATAHYKKIKQLYGEAGTGGATSVVGLISSIISSAGAAIPVAAGASVALGIASALQSAASLYSLNVFLDRINEIEAAIGVHTDANGIMSCKKDIVIDFTSDSLAKKPDDDDPLYIGCDFRVRAWDGNIMYNVAGMDNGEFIPNG